MRPSSQTPTINTGSMADIAFLLLIFFLVTTTLQSDVGIARKLPRPCPTGDCAVDVAARNLLSIHVNDAGDLLVNNDMTSFGQLRNTLREFIDNNGDQSCFYCRGSNSELSSENPNKAVISVNTDRQTPYKYFIKVQNEINIVYYELREKYACSIFNKDIDDLSRMEQQTVQDAYPMLIAEADIKQ